ncbi:uncharacterized protein [Pleurodeles waltl]|uniref:uncharacterized protein n=1 Tax=Pleurodeles waltl TaxID=8319 RepID=UPI00370970C5
MTLTFNGWKIFIDENRKLKPGQEPQKGHGYTMYHGTQKSNAKSIVTSGFRPSAGGTLGAGVYCSRNKQKAMCYPALCSDSDRVVFILKVRVGKVKKIDRAGVSLQATWHQNGYDTAWLPPTNGGYEEDCVWDPKRITIVGIAHCADAQLMAELKREINQLHQTHNSKSKCKICGQETKKPHITVRCWNCRAKICPYLNQHKCHKRKNLTEEDLVATLKESVTKFLEITKGSASLFNIWAAGKAYIRGEAISFKAYFGKKAREKSNLLQWELEQALKRNQSLPNPETESILGRAQARLRGFYVSQEILNRHTSFQRQYEESEHIGNLKLYVPVDVLSIKNIIMVYCISKVHIEITHDGTFARVQDGCSLAWDTLVESPRVSASMQSNKVVQVCWISPSETADQVALKWEHKQHQTVFRVGAADPGTVQDVAVFYSNATQMDDTVYYEPPYKVDLSNSNVPAPVLTESASGYFIDIDDFSTTSTTSATETVSKTRSPVEKYFTFDSELYKQLKEAKMSLDFHGWEIFQEGDFHLDAGQTPESGKCYTMYHGTFVTTARSIITSGFMASPDGMLGQGVYISRDMKKAQRYPLKAAAKDKVVLILNVDVGKVKKIDQDNHPMQKSWHSQGYDTAWVPPNCGMKSVPSGLEEDCVWDPLRIQVIDVQHATDSSIQEDLRSLLKQTNQSSLGQSTRKCSLCKNNLNHQILPCWKCQKRICPYLPKHVCK